ncbi:MAG: PfkB family carbohydrate kinase [Janthinobacterium lividum]
MSGLLALGDNTLDVYAESGMQYPGGNALNVAVLARRLGQQAAYLGCIGQDAGGAHLRAVLEREQVETSRLRVRSGRTARTLIGHVGGERRFLAADHGVRAEYALEAADYRYVARHALTHLSVHGEVETCLPRLRAAAPLISFDFSDCWDEAMLTRMLPFIDIPFLSAADLPADSCRALLQRCIAGGARLAVVTRGHAGAIALAVDGVRPPGFFEQPAIDAVMLDTLGAGDGFIAATLVGWLRREPLVQVFSAAAGYAAQICGWMGAFGCGRRTEEGDIETLRAIA